MLGIATVRLAEVPAFYFNMEHYHFIILILAVWRLSSLIAREEGPYDILLRLRLRLGTEFNERSVEIPTNHITKGITCLWCNSVWLGIAATGAYYLFPTATLVLAIPLAISAGSLIVERITNG